MKKEYTRPSMKIVSFKTENITTVSAATAIQSSGNFGTLSVSNNSVSY